MNETIQRVLAGDHNAFSAVVREYGPAIRAYLAAHLSRPDEVDDLAQETFVAAYQSLANFDTDADIGNWLRGIARNKLMKHLRGIYRREGALGQLKEAILNEVTAAVVPEPPGWVSPAVERVRECLAALPGRVRRVMVARYFDGEKVQDLAADLETSAVALSCLLYRGRRLLQDCMRALQ